MNMLATSAPSGGTRKGPGGRREAYVSGRGWVPESEAPITAAKASPASGEPIRRAATDKQREAWDAVKEHGTQQAACKALGMSQGTLQSRLKGYMKTMGLTGDLPGYSGPKQSERLEVKGHPAEAAHRPPEPDVEPAPGEPVKTLTEMRVVPEPPPELPTSPEVPPLQEPFEDDLLAEAHRVGYAQGYAVATLRAIASVADLPEQLRDIASDAADGLMA